MTHDSDPFMAAALLVMQSDDPAAELLKLARLESSRRRRRFWIKYCSVAALLLIGVGALWLAAERPSEQSAPELGSVIESARWVIQLGPKARHGPLSTEDEAKVRGYLRSESGLLRRVAVGALSTYGLEIDPTILDEVAFELTETLDHPVVVASHGGEHAADALFTNHQATLRAVAVAIWIHCARNHSYPRVETIERLLAHPDPEIRKSCCKALGHLTDYMPTSELRARIEADTAEIRRAARRLLSKAK